MLGLVFVDAFEVRLQVGHQRTHHAARQTRTDEQGVHQTVARRDVQTQEVVHELLDEGAHLHVGLHVDFGHLIAGVLQHGLHAEQVGVTRTPRQRLHAHVDVVASGFTDGQDAGHVEAGARMAVILDGDVLDLLDAGHNLAQRHGASDARHVLDADFVGTCLDELLGHVDVVFHRVYRRVGDAERALRNHAGLVGIADGGDDVAHVVQSAERAGDVSALRLLYLIEELAHVGRYGAHAEAVQRTVQHVCLYAGFMERFRPGTHGLIRVFSKKQIHLFEAAAVGFHAGKAAHLHNGGSHLHQLVNAGNILTGALPHVPEDQAELNFSFHR